MRGEITKLCPGVIARSASDEAIHSYFLCCRMDCFAYARNDGDGFSGCLKFESDAHPELSSSAKADDPVRGGLSALSLTPLEYWIARFRGR
jgi:hypothetical protein